MGPSISSWSSSVAWSITRRAAAILGLWTSVGGWSASNVGQGSPSAKRCFSTSAVLCAIREASTAILLVAIVSVTGCRVFWVTFLTSSIVWPSLVELMFILSNEMNKNFGVIMSVLNNRIASNHRTRSHPIQLDGMIPSVNHRRPKRRYINTTPACISASMDQRQHTSVPACMASMHK